MLGAARSSGCFCLGAARHAEPRGRRRTGLCEIAPNSPLHIQLAKAGRSPLIDSGLEAVISCLRSRDLIGMQQYQNYPNGRLNPNQLHSC